MDGAGKRFGETSGRNPPPAPPPPPAPLPPPPLSLSDLPDDVLYHIFSFLYFDDVVQIGNLSEWWRDLGMENLPPYLAFDRDGYLDTSAFQSRVDEVLKQFPWPTLMKFHVINLQYNRSTYPELKLKLDGWLKFAEKHSVKDLCLGLIASSDRFTYEPPQLLYCLSKLVRLEVSACCFSLHGATRIQWPLLKVLSMEDVELSDDILGRILRGSPVLESLKLARCQSVKNIVIDSPSVKDLLLMGGSFIELEKISAPHLLSLHVSGTWYPLEGQEDISLNVSSLVEAKLDFAIVTDRPGERTMCRKARDLLKQLLDKLHGVPTITIGDWCLQMEAVPSPLSKCQNLILHASVSPRDLPGIAYMLRSSQCLEKLVIHLPRSELKLVEELEERFNIDEEEFLHLQKGNLECLANHLKRAEIIGFGAYSFRSKHLLPLIEFLLGDALVLEKLVIEAKLPTPGVLSKLQKNVLSFRKASQNAKVIFD